MKDEEAFLSPARKRGFLLSEKQFAFFLVDGVKEIEFKEHQFRALSMQPHLKRMIHALAVTQDSHDSDTNYDGFDDIVQGKGRGIIISLEGPPGSGKTLTAG